MNLPRYCGALALSILLLAGPLTGQAGANPIPGDLDQDGDIDLADFADFQTCFLGPAISQTDPACSDARLDADPDVDLDDFAVFQDCLSGADNPADPNCACPSGQTWCDPACVDLTSDPFNCGGCGSLCAPGTCTEWICTPCEPSDIYGPCYCGPDHPNYPACN